MQRPDENTTVNDPNEPDQQLGNDTEDADQSDEYSADASLVDPQPTPAPGRPVIAHYFCNTWSCSALNTMIGIVALFGMLIIYLIIAYTMLQGK